MLLVLKSNPGSVAYDSQQGANRSDGTGGGGDGGGGGGDSGCGLGGGGVGGGGLGGDGLGGGNGAGGCGGCGGGEGGVSWPVARYVACKALSRTLYTWKAAIWPIQLESPLGVCEVPRRTLPYTARGICAKMGCQFTKTGAPLA